MHMKYNTNNIPALFPEVRKRLFDKGFKKNIPFNDVQIVLIEMFGMSDKKSIYWIKMFEMLNYIKIDYNGDYINYI